MAEHKVRIHPNVSGRSLSNGVSGQTTWPNDFGNWGRWDNQRGTLNLITPTKVLEAMQSVRLGQVFDCGADLTPEAYPEGLQQSHRFDAVGFSHEMFSAREFENDKYASQDKFSLSIHSLENTHIDALSHVGHLGKGFNGVDFFDMVSVERKAEMFDVMELHGIVTRAYLVDVPRIRGVTYIEPGDSVTDADLRAGAPDAGPGDALLVRTGRWCAPRISTDDPRAKGDPHGAWAGMDIDAFGFVAERDISLLGTDSVGDTFPLPHPDKPTVHIVAEVYLGLPLVHSLDLEELAEACDREGRNDALLMVAPLKIRGGTGSPVLPLCVL